MKKLQSYIISSLVGLTIYAAIVAVNDSAEGAYWLQRPVKQITIEVISCIVLGVLFNSVLYSIIRISSRLTRTVTPRTIVFELVAVVLISVLLFNPGLYVIHYLFDDDVDNQDIVIGNVIVVLFIIIQYLLIRGYRVMKIFADQQTELERITNSQLETELKFLRSQYHPHFLFNALNTVYFQMDESVTDAKQTIERLSALLRYQLYEHQQQVKLSVEVEYLRNYIAFMKERLSSRLKLNVNFNEPGTGIEVYPLLLQPLIENAFKYVGGEYTIDISMIASGNRIQLDVSNSIADGGQKEGKGIGLENLRRRLSLLYPDGSSLLVQQEERRFVANLMIDTSRAHTHKTNDHGNHLHHN